MDANSTMTERPKRRKLVEPAPEQGLIKIHDSQASTDAYHKVMSGAEEFSRISANVPKALLRVIQSIHGDLNTISMDAFKCGNERDIRKKILLLEDAYDGLLALFSEIEYLVRAKGMTVGQANNLLGILRDAHGQIGNWLASLRKRS